MTDPSTVQTTSPEGSGKAAATTLTMIALVSFVTTLDNNIVAAGAPSIGRDLSLSLAELQWISIGYMLPFATLLLVGGRLVDRWGQRRTLTLGLLAFGLGAMIGGYSESGLLLVMARVLQGVAAAFVVPGALSLLRTNLNSRQRAVGAAIWTASLAMALAVGPTIGGLLTEYLDWGWIFFCNVPFVLASLAMIPATASATRTVDGEAPQMLSMTLVTGGLALGTVAVVGLGDDATWSPALLLALGAGAVVAMTTFLLRERRSRNRLVPAVLLRQRAFFGALLVQMLWGLGVSGVFFFTPLLHQDSLGLSPAGAGLPLALVAVAIVAVTPLVSGAVARFGSHLTVFLGLSVVALGLLAVAVINHIPEVAPRIPGLLLIGAGSALTTPLTSFALELVSEQHAGTASGLLTASRELASALGVALIGVVLAGIRTSELRGGTSGPIALANGYTGGLIVAAGLELAGAFIALRVFRVRPDALSSASDAKP